MARNQNSYLETLVAQKLAERGLPGTVRIRPHKPLAARLESGERAMFVITYEGDDTARLTVDEYQIACGTTGASVVTALADLIERECPSMRDAA